MCRCVSACPHLVSAPRSDQLLLDVEPLVGVLVLHLGHHHPENRYYTTVATRVQTDHGQRFHNHGEGLLLVESAYYYFHT